LIFIKGFDMSSTENLLDKYRGKYRIITTERLGQGVNASVYKLKIDTTYNELKSKLAEEKQDLVLRLIDAQNLDDEVKAVKQFENYRKAWKKLWDGKSVYCERFMKPIFCERGINSARININGISPKSTMKMGDAIFSYKGGQSVFNLWKNKQLPSFTTWSFELCSLLEELCSKEIHFRDWHSENVLLEKNKNGSWKMRIIDPGSIIDTKKVVWEYPQDSVKLQYEFDKNEVGVSIIGVQDLIYVGTNLNKNIFFNEFAKIIAHNNRQSLFPKMLIKR
jgi:hypothetical protein